MKQKKLAKTFMVVSNKKTPLVSMVSSKSHFKFVTFALHAFR